MTDESPVIHLGEELPTVPLGQRVNVMNLDKLNLHGGEVEARSAGDGAFIRINGWTISVIWRIPRQAEAEVMVFDADGNEHHWKDGDLAIHDATLARIQNIADKIAAGTLTYSHQEPAPSPETRYDDGWVPDA